MFPNIFFDFHQILKNGSHFLYCAIFGLMICVITCSTTVLRLQNSTIKESSIARVVSQEVAKCEEIFYFLFLNFNV